MTDKTVGVSITLYKSQIDKVEKYLSDTKKFKSVASFFQYLVDNFFNKKTGMKDFAIFIGYPLIFTIVMLYVAVTTQSVNLLLLDANIISDLLIYTQIYYLIGFVFLGLLFAGFIFIWHKARTK